MGSSQSSSNFKGRFNFVARGKPSMEEAGGEGRMTLGLQTFPDERDKQQLVRYVRESVIGRDICIELPFGYRNIVYCDYIASGKSLSFIEDYIRQVVMPLYANTHTEVSFTGKQMMGLREEARSIIMKCCNADAEKDVLIFAGSGSTTCMNRLAMILGLAHLPTQPVVLVGPYEHHSNILPWRETGAKVVFIVEDENGLMCMKDLEKKLQNYCDGKRVVIGSFSAGSNVTGIITTNQDEIALLLHKYGALSFWDFACTAPYVKIDMNPSTNDGQSYKDVIFLSPHKFIGGPETPGLFIMKRSLYKIDVPSYTGGGTINIVTHKDTVYVHNICEREEGGTPSIIGAIRCGMVFQLKNAIGDDYIHGLETKMFKKVLTRLNKMPNVVLLGNTNVDRLPILSFIVKHREAYLFPQFVSNLLNDLFGIQTRASCSCAAPYGMVLFGAPVPWIEQMYAWAKEKEQLFHLIKMGFTRLSFNYFFDEETVDYVLNCIEWVSNHGYKLLPLYRPQKSWSHFSLLDPEEEYQRENHLYDISYANGVFEFLADVNDKIVPPNYHETLKLADEIVNEFMDFIQGKNEEDKTRLEEFIANVSKDQVIFENVNDFRWFPLPSEVMREIMGKEDISFIYKDVIKHPFSPEIYPRKEPAPETYPDDGKVDDASRCILDFQPKERMCATCYK